MISIKKSLFFVMFLTSCIKVEVSQGFWGSFFKKNISVVDPKLFQAVKGDHISLVRTLLNSGSDVNAVDKKGKTVLMYAAEYGYIEMVHTLLSYGAALEIKDKQYCATALFYAAYNGNQAIIRALLGEGASVNIVNIYGQTPLYVACYYGNYLAVESLILCGAKVNNEPDRLSKKKKYYWKNPLIVAARNGHADIVKILLELGTPVDVATVQGKTALMYAAAYGQFDAVRVLLAYNASTTMKDKRGHTAYHYTSYEQIKELLLQIRV